MKRSSLTVRGEKITTLYFDDKSGSTRIRVATTKKGKFVAAYVHLGKLGKRDSARKTDELVAGNVFADYSDDGKLVGIEILGHTVRRRSKLVRRPVKANVKLTPAQKLG